MLARYDNTHAHAYPVPSQPATQNAYNRPRAQHTFREGVRLGDGRIRVPLAFVNHNFASAAFPVMLWAELEVNGDVVHAGCQVGAISFRR